MEWIQFPLGYFDSITGWVSLYACTCIYILHSVLVLLRATLVLTMYVVYLLFSGKQIFFSAPLITYSVWFYDTVPLHVCVTITCPRSDKSLLESPLLHTLLSVLGEPANLSSWWENPPNTCYQTVGLVHQLCLVMVDWLPSLLEKTNSPGESG